MNKLPLQIATFILRYYRWQVLLCNASKRHLVLTNLTAGKFHTAERRIDSNMY